MSLLEKLTADVRDAMRAKDELTRDTLRMVLAALKAREIEANRPNADEDVKEALRSGVKTRAEAASQFEAAGRVDLAAKERREIDVLARYLPQQISEDETRSLVQRLIAETGATSKKDIGRVMKAVMASWRDQVDGKLVQRIAGELLE